MKTFRNKFYLALLIFVSVFALVSCSNEDDLPPSPNDPPAGEHVPNPAGDDFYMYVNGAWHSSLGDDDVDTGFMIDVVKITEEKSNGVLDEMEEARILRNSCKQLVGEGLEANKEYAKNIIDEISGRIEDAETKEEVGQILGECIASGYVDCMLRLYSAIPKEGDKVCFTLIPDAVTSSIMSGVGGDDEEDDEDEEDDDEVEQRKLLGKRFSLGTYEKYTGKMTRSGGNDFMTSVVEGIGLDPDYFVVEETLRGMYENLSNSTLDELKETIVSSLMLEFSLYGGDEMTQEITGNTIGSTSEFLEKQLPELLAYPLSYYYCEKYVNDMIKEEYAQYAETMRSVFAERIEANEWLSAPTRQEALDKLMNMKFFIGEPGKWYTETFPTLQGDDLFVENVLEAKKSRNNTIISILGKNKRDEAMNLLLLAFKGTPLTEHNAFHLPEVNSIMILPSFMMAPEYTSDMDVAKKFALFYVIGHEMTHGFDLEGSKYDVNGDINDWWDPIDKEHFFALNNALAQQISTFEIAPGIMTDGNRTITEDVADLGGMNIALDALTEHLERNGATAEEMAQAHKVFYEYNAYRYRLRYSERYFQYMQTSEHSVSMVRVNGIVQHMDKWYELYNVVEGDLLYLPKEKRITIW